MNKSTWIVNRSYDLAFFILSSLIGFFALIYLTHSPLDPFLVFILFKIFFDQPHTVQTLILIRFDNYAKNKKIFYFSFLLFLPGILSLILDETYKTNSFYAIYTLFFSIYGTWHIYRQHYGFYKLYQIRGDKYIKWESLLEHYLFHLIFIVGLILVHLRSTQFIINNKKWIIYNEAFVQSLLLNSYNLLIAFFLVFISIYPKLTKRKINYPKLLLFLSSFLFMTTILNSPYFKDIHYLIYLAVFTLHHNIQYFGITFLYSKSSFNRDNLFTRILTDNFFNFLSVSFIVSVLFFGFKWIFINNIDISFLKFFSELGSQLILDKNKISVKDLVFVFFTGFALQHYYLDQKIWKMKDVQTKLLKE